MINLHAAGYGAHFRLLEFTGFLKGVVHRRQHQVLQHLDVLGVNGGLVDDDGEHVLSAVGYHGHHAAAAGGFDGLLAKPFLQLGHLFLHHLRSPRAGQARPSTWWTP